jgi:GTP diphosphokinase / guanosine-3',5'-bis(diphosphate) 3'-diphosphatase
MKIDLSLITGQEYWSELANFLPETVDRETIRRAFDFAYIYHLDQKRESGEPYITHPVWIAKVVAQLGLGTEAIVAALLHDCVEDTNATLEEVADNFGDEVALLVEGLTEISHKTKDIELHKTNIAVFRNFLFSSVNDVRVLIIRLVDKLHNGLTIRFYQKKDN